VPPGPRGRVESDLDRWSTVDARQRWGLAWALGLSILLHALLVLLSVWMPISRDIDALAAEAATDSITFSFADDVTPTTDDPLQDAPFLPLDEREAAAPTPVPRPSNRPPSPELEPIPPTPPVPETEAIEEAPREFEADGPVETVEPEGADWREAPDASVREAPTVSREPAPDRELDLQEAMKEFAQAMRSRPVAPVPSSPSGGPEQHVIVPDLSRIPYSGFGVGNLVFESRDYDWRDYGRQVYMAIWRAWHERLWLTTDDFTKWAFESRNGRLDHGTRVRFVIERNGQVTGVLQEEGSGCEPLDASAIDALTSVVLPPLPEGFPRDREVVHARFLAQGLVVDMRGHLGNLKRAGFF